MGKSLVIVESPAKAKTINKFLGPDYEVTASMGHVMDLPQKSMGVDVEKDFEPSYVVIPKNKKTVSRLKKEAGNKQEIYLAPDPDREGEAISWHLANMLKDINPRIYRVSFNEITLEAVKSAFSNPGSIDLNKVNAQQARRILDRIVGYNLSPLLWKKVGRGLSAGRVQSVTLRLICEREKQITAFDPAEYWLIEAELSKTQDQMKSRGFVAVLVEIKDEKAEISDKKQADSIVSDLKDKCFIIEEIKDKKKTRRPSPPFITSKLQQEAYNRLRFSAHRTMRIAQQLYEGIEVGEKDSQGLITYMRTDSVRVSEAARKQAGSYIAKTYGAKYLPKAAWRYKSKKSAQGAHEAIRPTSVLRSPQQMVKFLTPDQHKLYHLIWNKFLASQMASALISTRSVNIKAGYCLFRVSSSSVIFDGWTVLLEDKEKEKGIPALKEGEQLTLVNLTPTQHFTKPPPHYSDASLIKDLEEKGIGRPSTYAPIIYTILIRDYVRRDGGMLLPTELGIVVTDLLVKHFPEVLNAQFTAEMELSLDRVEEGSKDWVGLLKSFYLPFSKSLDLAKDKMKNIKKEAVPTSEICRECGKPMVIKWGAHGRFLACSGFPECRHTRSITTGIKCPQADCDGEVVKRRSKKGRFFYACTNWPKCKYIARKLPEET
ncbi:MAG: type I DNA topoisomerase [Candidatus Omnitrophota bacterium]|nr:type I DNA topoisomerase [Candidatus Omnitrophota bacterium]